MPKSQSSKQWLRRHVNDPYVQRSKRDGYRSRSAYKLTEIDERDRILRAGQVIVDLGAAPGGWSQVVAKRVGAEGLVIGIDLLPVEPVPNALMIQADFTTRKGLDALHAALAGRRVDLVLSDMAPNLSGIAVSDQARSMGLAEAALAFALDCLGPEGAFLVKVFQGVGYDEYMRAMRAGFSKVLVRKPDASRSESAEHFLLGKGLRPGPVPQTTGAATPK